MNKLAKLKEFLILNLQKMQADKCHLMLVNGQILNGNMSYTVRLLLIDYCFDPLQVLSLIRAWLEQNNLLLDDSGNEVALSFSSEIINTETFDLEIDFPLSQKVVLDGNDYHICSKPRWNNETMQFERPE